MVNETGTSSNIENYKIAIIGNQHVGKTTILSRYKYETTDDTYAPTVGIDFLTKNVFLEDKTIRLVMWDTAGQERFKSLIPSYLKNANCVILTYDITDKSSFTSLNKWLSDVRDNVVEGTFIILCGNKIDLNDKRVVSFEEGKNLANEKNIIFEEVSAKDGQNFNELFSDKLFNELYKKFKNKFDNNNIRKKEQINNEYIEDNEISNNTNVKLELDGNNINYQKKKKKKCC